MLLKELARKWNLPDEALEVVAATQGALADSPSIYLLSTPARPPVVLHLSRPEHPGSVAQASAREQAFRSSISPRTERLVLKTLLTGEFEGRSWAVAVKYWPVSRSRVVSYLQRSWVRRRVCQWLVNLARETKSETTPIQNETFFGKPLDHLIGWPGLPAPLVDRARKARSRLNGGFWSPVRVAMHGDLHPGNLVFTPLGRPQVIDWGTALVAGYPFVDFLKFSATMRMPRSYQLRWIKKLCPPVLCSPVDISGYLMCWLGYLAANLNCFAPEDFLAEAVRIHQQLGSLGL